MNAKLSISRDQGFSAPSFTNTGTLHAQADGKLLIKCQGRLSTPLLASDTNRVVMVRLNADGSVDTGFNVDLDVLAEGLSLFPTSVGPVVLMPGGQIAVSVNHQLYAKWDGNSWSALGSGMNGGVSTLAVSGSDLYIGGEFTTAGGKVSSDIARAYLPNLPALSVRGSGSDVEVSWLSADTAGFVLEQANPLTRSAGWIPNTTGVTEDGTHRSVTLPRMNSAQFFRLRKP